MVVVRNDAQLAAAGLQGPLVSSARRLPLGDPDAWALSGPGETCLVTAGAPFGGTSEDVLDCVRDAAARLGYLMTARQDSGGTLLVEGLLPDGAGRAQLHAGSGRALGLRLRGGAYRFAAVRPRSVSFLTHGRRLAVAVPSPPLAETPRRR